MKPPMPYSLQSTPAAVVLSGYAHALYDHRLSDWDRYTFATMNMRGSARTEVVWVKPAAGTQIVAQTAQSTLFESVEGV